VNQRTQPRSPSLTAAVPHDAARTHEAAPSGNGQRAPLIDAAQLAVLLGVSRDFIYEHADELGALRLGSGPRARLRFDLDAALSRYGSERSQTHTANGGGDSDAMPARRSGKRRDGLPQPGSILPIRPRRKAGAR
jgi:hypothetical protein